MAIGDDAIAAGFPLVPGTGEEGRVRWGAREINRTRDFVAQTQSKIPTKSTVAGSTVVTMNSAGNVGIYFPVAFKSPPVVVAMNGDYLNGPSDVLSIYGSTSNDHFSIHIIGGAGAHRRINWIAVGYLT